jgi:hypothetical protein
VANNRNQRNRGRAGAGTTLKAKPPAVPVSKPKSSAAPVASNGDITIFLSYTRADDGVYDMVRPFKEMLGHFIYAKSGRKVKTFLDQDNIGWGEIWRERLESEILGASVFIPLLSAAYLDSDNCRMEFNKFQANATALGVKELLLPVLLLNAPAIFNENSTDDVVREAAARQWEIIEEAVLSDHKSSAWKTTMARLADRFVAAYEAAEAKLADTEVPERAPLSIEDLEDGEDGDDEEPGIAELTASLENGLNELAAISSDMGPAIEGLGKAANSVGALDKNSTAHQIQAWSLNAARAFREPSEKVSELGECMFNTTKKVDLDMQRLRRIAVEFLPANRDMAVNYNQSIQQLTGLDVVSRQLNSLLDTMKPAEYFSVPLRKSLRPARRGLTRVTDSLRLIETWQPIEIPEG